MTSEEVKSELEKTIGKANVRLLEVMNGKPISDVVISATYEGSTATVRSGDKILIEVELEYGGLKKAKPVIWSVVDSARGVSADRQHSPKLHFSTKEDIQSELGRIVDSANSMLERACEKGFPFTYEEVKISCEITNTAVFVKSGNTPVAAEICGWDVFGCLSRIKHAVRDAVEDTRAAIERRGGIKDDADNLQSEGERLGEAIAALKSAGVDPSIIPCVDEEAGKEIVRAAQEAVKEANRCIYMSYGDACELQGDDARLKVKGFVGGLVVLSGSKPCLVTRFPKAGNNKTLERTVSFIKSDIAALGESLRKYLEKIQKRIETEHLVRVEAQNCDALLAKCAGE